MSTVGRNPEHDRNATAMIVQAVLQGAPIPMEEPNWLGHSEQAAALDRALIHGEIRAMLEQIRPSESRHRSHLNRVHGIHVEEVDGMFRFSRQQ